MKSVFADKSAELWKHRWEVDIYVDELHGGVPYDENKAAAWIKAHVTDPDANIPDMVARTMLEMSRDGEETMSVEEAAEETARLITLNGFKSDPEIGLYEEGRKVKSMLKEAIIVAIQGGHIPQAQKWGKTTKQVRGYFAEHVFVLETRIPLGVNEPTGVRETFVSGKKIRSGISAIKREEYVEGAKLSFTIVSDTEFDWNFWSIVLSIAEKNGFGATRSMGFGTFTTTRFDKVA